VNNHLVQGQVGLATWSNFSCSFLCTMKRTKQQQRPRRKRKAAKQLNGGLAKKAKMEKNGYSSSSSLAAAPVAKTTVMKNEGPEFKYKSNGDIRVSIANMLVR